MVDSPVLVLVNVSAGSAEEERVEQVRRSLERCCPAGVDVRDAGPDEEYAAAVASAAGRDVVVVGGDGSVRRLLQELHDQDLLGRAGAVGVVPLGTGNDLARDAGIPLELEPAADVAVRGAPQRRALLVDDDGQVVANVVHCGVAAEATAHAAEVKGVLGRAAYLWGAVLAGLTRKGWHLRVVVDGQTLVDGRDAVLMVSVALGSSVGGGTPIAPQARPQDGQADVVVACGTSARSRVGFARALRRGRHAERDDVRVARGTEVVVEAVSARDAFRVNADGDVEERRVDRRRWRLLDDAWSLRVPR